MSRDSRFETSPSAAHSVAGKVSDAQATEAIDSAVGSEASLHFGPARGIINAVFIGVGAWMIIFGAVALTRAIFFG